MSIFDKVYNERIKLYENVIGSQAQPGVVAPKTTASPIITPKTTATTTQNPNNPNNPADATQQQTPAEKPIQQPQNATQVPTIPQALKALIIAKQQGQLDNPDIQTQINDAMKQLAQTK